MGYVLLKVHFHEWEFYEQFEIAHIEGCPKMTFLVIMLEKNGKNEVRERFRKKHEIWMGFGCQHGRLWEGKILFLLGTPVKNRGFGDSEIS